VPFTTSGISASAVSSFTTITTSGILSSGLGTFGNITTSGYVKAQGAISSSVGFNASAGSTLQSLTLGTPLTVGNGGTGRNSFAANSILVGNNTSGINSISAGALGQVFAGKGIDTIPAWSSDLFLTGNIQANGTASATQITASTGFYSPGTSYLTTLNATNINTATIIGDGLATFGSLYVNGNTQLGKVATSTTSVWGTLNVVHNSSTSGSITSDASGNLILEGSGVSSGV